MSPHVQIITRKACLNEPSMSIQLTVKGSLELCLRIALANGAPRPSSMAFHVYSGLPLAWFVSS